MSPIGISRKANSGHILTIKRNSYCRAIGGRYRIPGLTTPIGKLKLVGTASLLMHELDTMLTILPINPEITP
jgi:hypothetical protein